jgi:hypothetical protein
MQARSQKRPSIVLLDRKAWPSACTRLRSAWLRASCAAASPASPGDIAQAHNAQAVRLAHLEIRQRTRRLA